MRRGSSGLAQIGPDALLGADDHRAELEDVERTAVEAHAALAVEDRAAVGERGSRARSPRRAARERRAPRAEMRDVERALDQAHPARERHLRQVDDRQAVEVLDAGAEGDVLEEVRHDAHVGDRAADLLEDGEHRAVRLERQREEDRVDAALLDDARATSAVVPRTGTPEVLGAALARVVVDEPDGAQSRLGVLEELVDDGAAQAARADDEHVPHADAVAPGLLEVAADRRPAGEHEEDVEREEEDEHERASRRSPR